MIPPEVNETVTIDNPQRPEIDGLKGRITEISLYKDPPITVEWDNGTTGRLYFRQLFRE